MENLEGIQVSIMARWSVYECGIERDALSAMASREALTKSEFMTVQKVIKNCIAGSFLALFMVACGSLAGNGWDSWFSRMAIRMDNYPRYSIGLNNERRVIDYTAKARSGSLSPGRQVLVAFSAANFRGTKLTKTAVVFRHSDAVDDVRLEIDSIVQSYLDQVEAYPASMASEISVQFLEMSRPVAKVEIAKAWIQHGARFAKWRKSSAVRGLRSAGLIMQWLYPEEWPPVALLCCDAGRKLAGFDQKRIQSIDRVERMIRSGELSSGPLTSVLPRK